MPLEDRFGLTLSTRSAAAAADYVAAVDLMLSANAGAEAPLDRALSADPEFALAHIATARLLQAQARLPERIGGSHAQREVFEDTYIVACLRAGAHDKAKERLASRLARRPSARDERWLAAATNP